MTRILVASALVALTGFAADAEASRAQLVHLSPDAPAVDVWVNGQGPRLTDIPYLGATGSGKVAAGTYDIDITAAGDVDPVISASVTFEPATAYTIVAWDEVANIKPAVLVNDLDGLMPGDIRLQITHTAVGVGMVDLWELDLGVMLVNDFDFGDSGRLDVAAGPRNLGLDLNEDAVPDVTFSVPDLGADTMVNVFPIADDDGVALYAVFFDGTTARVDAD